MEVGCRVSCIGNRGVVVGKHWVVWDCCCGRRNLGDFSNRGYMCFRRGYFMGIGHCFALHWHAQRLGKWIDTQQQRGLEWHKSHKGPQPQTLHQTDLPLNSLEIDLARVRVEVHC